MHCLIRTSTTHEPIVTTATYDGERRALTTVYDAVGNVQSATNGPGVVTSYAYDALNRRVAELDAYGTSVQRTTTMAYDADDNVTASIDPLGYRTTYGYDALNRRVTVQDAGGGVTTMAFDAGDNVTTQIDQLGHTTTYAYDVLNRKTQTTDARGGVVTLAYDANSNLLSLTDPVNNQTQWQYDALDRKAQETDPLNSNATYAYDAADRVTSATDRVGQRIAYAYDLLNRETSETWYNAGGASVNTLTFTYDANSNLLTAANNTATNTMAYDALDRKTIAQDPFGAALTYAYDAADNRTQMQDSFGATTTRVYDALNRTTTMMFGGTGQTPLREDFTYSARDQVASQTRYSNLAGATTAGYSTYGYDTVAWLTTLQHQNGAGANIANYTNTYDLASRITSETLNGGAPTTYAYDAVNELTNDGVASYAYDANGNRTMTGYATGSANELTSDGTWGYYYDANGNRVRKANPSTGEAYTYGYDNRNRLVSAQDATSAGVQMQATYVYDALGKRIEKDVAQSGATTTTRFAYDGREIWADLNSSNALVTRYVRGDRILELLARVSGGGTAAWVLADRMGTVRAVVDATGVLLDIITYDGYGNVTNETSPTNGGVYKAFGYRYDSETGLYRPDPTTARYYNPTTGNWNGRDPWGFGAGDVSLYRYVWNNPTNGTDPSGLDFIAVAERGIGRHFLARMRRRSFNHMSLEYWSSCKDPQKPRDFHIFQTGDLQDTFEASLGDSVELLNATGWQAWIYDPGVLVKDWEKRDVSISVISYYTSMGDWHLPIYVGEDVQKMWKKILQYAHSYGYAEQRASGYSYYPESSEQDPIVPETPIRHWPNSRYFAVEIEATLGGANNSNTFVREAVRQVLNMSDIPPGLPGFQPGENAPRDVPGRYYDSRGPFLPTDPLRKPDAPPPPP